MYIHAYQIDNVLNVYRKQLSQKTRANGLNPGPVPATLDRVNLSHESQRQSIIDQVSANILQQITKHIQEDRFEEPLEPNQEGADGQGNNPTQDMETKFSYTMIDENNFKWTNTLSFNGGGPLTAKTGQQDQMTADKA